MRRRDFAMWLSTVGCGLLQFPKATAQTLSTGSDELSTSNEGTDDLSGPSHGPWRRLFLDGTVVEQQSGLIRSFHAAEKVAANPLMVADQPWEGQSAIIGPYVYGTVLREAGKFRMWHQLIYQGNHVGYAESTDGIHWTKPLMDVVRYQGQATNLVVSEFDSDLTGGVCHNPSVIRQAHVSDPERRFALYGFDTKVGQPRVAYSSDGLHWRYHGAGKESGLFSSSDVVNFAYDPYRSRYLATWKTRNRMGRAVGIATSTDGLQWNKPLDGAVFGADDLDPDATQIYGMPVFPYQGLYIGLPWIYRARYFRYGDYSVEKLHEAQSDSPRTMEVQMAWSWDLINWVRPPSRQQFIPLGSKGAWDAGMIVTARAPVRVGDDLYFYFGGTDRVHDESRLKAGIGLAKLRVDGFCSMQSQGTDEGWLISRREPMQRPAVQINAKCLPGGAIRAELLDRKNRVLRGFSKEDCLPFEGDATAHTLTWKTESFGEKHTAPDYKIRFWLNKAELYSYLPLAES